MAHRGRGTPVAPDRDANPEMKPTGLAPDRLLIEFAWISGTWADELLAAQPIETGPMEWPLRGLITKWVFDGLISGQTWKIEIQRVWDINFDEVRWGAALFRNGLVAAGGFKVLPIPHTTWNPSPFTFSSPQRPGQFEYTTLAGQWNIGFGGKPY